MPLQDPSINFPNAASAQLEEVDILASRVMAAHEGLESIAVSVSRLESYCERTFGSQPPHDPSPASQPAESAVGKLDAVLDRIRVLGYRLNQLTNAVTRL